MSKIPDYPAAATLGGTELLVGEQAGATVKMTTQAVADLGGGGGLVDQTLADDVVVTMPGYSVKYDGARVVGTVTFTSNCFWNYGGGIYPTYDDVFIGLNAADSAGAGQSAAASIDVYVGTDAAPESANVAIVVTGILGDVSSGGTFQMMQGTSNWTQTYADGGTPSDNHQADIAVLASSTESKITLTAQKTAHTGVVTTISTALASLPSAASAGAGARAFVTDALTTLILGLGTTVADGGANKVPVYSDGTNWIYG